jgi:DNA mismatch endonuclease (patch repair protein)
LAVFVDGDFWHGKNLSSRLEKLSKGHNSEYWIRKIKSNVARNRRVRRELRALGWKVIRAWEGEINSHVDRVAGRIVRIVRDSSPPK